MAFSFKLFMILMAPSSPPCWTFGDGTGGQAISPDHVYSAGTFTARVTVTDNAGATASAAITITASSPPVSTARFKVLHWNVAYGRGTDNIVD